MEINNEQIISLAKFALEVLEDFPDMGSLDGFDLQELAEKHKLLVPQTVYAPCDEDGCWCSEYHGSEDMQKGVACYRIADWLVRADELRNEAVDAGADESSKEVRTED